MAANLTIWLGELTAIITGDFRYLTEWKDQKPTDVRVRDSVTNADVAGVDAIVTAPALGVAVAYLRIPDAQAETLKRGDIVRISGGQLSGTIDSRKDTRDIRVAIFGVEHVEVVGPFVHKAAK